ARYMLGMAPTDYAQRGEAISNTPQPAVNMKQVTKSVWDNCATWSYLTGCRGGYVERVEWQSDSSYDSPINMANQCESNHIIVMTDGAPTQDSDYNSVNNITGGSCSTTVGFEGSDHEKDRKSTRLNSSHVKISYAVFCL